MQDEMIHHRWHFHRKYKLTSQQFHVAINPSNPKTMKTRTARSFRYLTAVSNTEGRPLKQWRRWTRQLKVEFQLHEVTKHGNTDIYILCLCEYSHIVMNNHLQTDWKWMYIWGFELFQWTLLKLYI